MAEELQSCQGCEDSFPREEFVLATCLGCNGTFTRCPKCFTSFTSCSGKCREISRAKLGEFFGRNAPRIKGPPDPGPSSGSLF